MLPVQMLASVGSPVLAGVIQGALLNNGKDATSGGFRGDAVVADLVWRHPPPLP